MMYIDRFVKEYKSERFLINLKLRNYYKLRLPKDCIIKCIYITQLNHFWGFIIYKSSC